jgi:hypothetical protein
MGDSSLAGDARWSGSYGVNLDYVARSHCSVEFISIEDIQVNDRQSICIYAIENINIHEGCLSLMQPPFMILQNILEKFEFFPIKCRVQRSLENFQKAQEQKDMHKGRQFTQKVS